MNSIHVSQKTAALVITGAILGVLPLAASAFAAPTVTQSNSNTNQATATGTNNVTTHNSASGSGSATTTVNAFNIITQHQGACQENSAAIDHSTAVSAIAAAAINGTSATVNCA